jgi:hypothetical protein
MPGLYARVQPAAGTFFGELQEKLRTRRDAGGAQAVVIHEALHSLGLPENPPASAYITRRVSMLCWR